MTAYLAISILLASALIGCGGRGTDTGAAEQEPGAIEETEVDEMMTEDRTEITVTIGDQKFTVSLEDNATARAFVDMLPLTIDMDDLNDNEKYYYLGTNIRQDSAKSPGTIHAGDIMCYSSDCLVFFYETFSTSYSYVRIGHVEDAEKFVEALGSGSVEVTIE